MLKNAMKKNRKVAIFVAESETEATQIIKKELNSLGAKCSVFSHENLFYTSEGLIHNGVKINLNEYTHGILRLSHYFSKKYKKKFNFFNEINILLKNLNNSFILNGKAYAKNPFYNKFTQIELFRQHKIPAIPSFHTAINNKKNILAFLKRYKISFPCVTKISNSSQGAGVYKIENKSELTKFIEKNQNKNIIFQKFIDNDGDYRVLVIGGRSLGVMKRIRRSAEWRNNLSLQATSAPVWNETIEKIAIKACKKIGLDFAGVDIIKAGKKYYIIEINDVPGFKGFEGVFPNINVARILAKYVLNKR
jgi:RimK family alpha-L-glutamate ligase